jgi:tRNA A-37 threonylcarbamoyl transferase component Bud32
VAGSNSGLDSVDARDCLSTDEVLALLDQRLEGTHLQGVRDHLDACSGCRVVMAEAARVATNSSQAPRIPRTLADGENIARRYEIRRFIARGGMGEVYEAFDSALGETIALKTLIVTAVDQADAVKRLLAEVRIARKVTHPNVCRILEFGTHRRTGSSDEPVPFLTMPLLQGETLARRLERAGRLAPSDALRVLADLTAGLAAVHEVGVVHRDFKSDNVFLVRNEDGRERAVVMDFGLARAMETHGAGNHSTGRVLVGTPAYMAPEQVEGKPITKAVDVYALGVVAFELLTGRVPFVAESPAAVALARLQRGPAAPSSVVPDLDRGWDDVVQRCLRRAPDQRYRNMTEVMAALERLREGKRRLSWRPATAVGIAAATVAVAVVATMPSRRSVSRVDEGTAAAAAAPQRERTEPSAPPAAAKSVPVPPPSAIKHERVAPARRKGALPPIVPAPPGAPAPAHSPAPPPAALPSSTASAEPPRAEPPSAPPFDRPAVSHPRQPDDLVDPFAKAGKR